MQLTTIPVSVRESIVQLDRFVKIFDGFLILVEFDVKQPSVVIRNRVIGLQFDGPVIGRQGLFVFFIPDILFSQTKLVFSIRASCHHECGNRRQCNRKRDLKWGVAIVSFAVSAHLPTSDIDKNEPLSEVL